MNIISLLDRQTVLPGLEAENKEEVLNKLIDTLKGKADDEELDNIREAVFEREQIMSTGVGKGLAIPHGKAAGIRQNYAAFALLKEPVDYNAIDGEPVTMVFLLVGPQGSNNFHIKMLSRISRLMNNSEFRETLAGCNSAQSIIDVFSREEESHFGGST